MFNAKQLLQHYRWLLVCLLLLPLSVLHKGLSCLSSLRGQIFFPLNTAPKRHREKVRQIQRKVREWNDAGRKLPFKYLWQGAKKVRGIDVDLTEVLYLDEHSRRIILEPGVTMGQLTRILSQTRWTIPVMSQKNITVADLISRISVESGSHNLGCFHDTYVAFELVLRDGNVIWCSMQDNADVFGFAPWTTGILTAVEMRLIPIKPYVKLRYKGYHNVDVTLEAFQTAASDDNNQFVECIMYNKDQGVVMTGTSVDQSDPDRLNEIGKWHKPWFYQHVKTILSKGFRVEYIPTWDYFRRHVRSAFWQLEEILPQGNNIIFRMFFGWAMPLDLLLFDWVQTKIAKQHKRRVEYDILVPVEKLKTCVEFFDTKFKVYPMWLCPSKFLRSTQLDQVFVNIGLYGTPRERHYKCSTGDIQAFVRQVKGYVVTELTENQFREIFDCKRSRPERYKEAQSWFYKDAFFD